MVTNESLPQCIGQVSFFLELKLYFKLKKLDGLYQGSGKDNSWKLENKYLETYNHNLYCGIICK